VYSNDGRGAGEMMSMPVSLEDDGMDGADGPEEGYGNDGDAKLGRGCGRGI